MCPPASNGFPSGHAVSSRVKRVQLSRNIWFKRRKVFWICLIKQLLMYCSWNRVRKTPVKVLVLAYPRLEISSQCICESYPPVSGQARLLWVSLYLPFQMLRISLNRCILFLRGSGELNLESRFLSMFTQKKCFRSNLVHLFLCEFVADSGGKIN